MSNLYFNALGHIDWAAMPANITALFGVAIILAIPVAIILVVRDNRNSYSKDTDMTNTDNNTDTATTATTFNLFNLLRSFGYKAVDAFVAIPELSWIVGKELTIQSASFGWFAIKGLLAGVKLVGMIAMFCLVMGLMIPAGMVVGTAMTAKDAVVSGYRKVTGFFSAKKAQAKAWVAAKKAARAAAKAEAEAKAEAARILKLKADAATIGMVTSEEVAEMIGAVMALVKASNKELQNTIAMMDSTLPAMPRDLEPIVDHAKAIVLKAVEEMTLAEMRQELGIRGFNTVQLRAKVRAAREEVPEANNL
jgi:hypothetical protein